MLTGWYLVDHYGKERGVYPQNQKIHSFFPYEVIDQLIGAQ